MVVHGNADITHGLGATYVGTCLVLICWLTLKLVYLENYQYVVFYKDVWFFIPFASWCILLLLIRFSYIRVFDIFNDFINMTFIMAVKEDFKNNKKNPIEIRLDTKDNPDTLH